MDKDCIWPEWRIKDLIGQGAYGKVYRMEKSEFGHTSHAAAKIIEIPQDASEIASLADEGLDSLSIRSYFESTARNIGNEIAVMESLKGASNVVSIEDYRLVEHEDGIGWTIYIRMELLQSLTDYQKEAGPPGVEEAVRIGVDICNALACCEERNVVHRDVKPGNVFRNAFGEYKLGDFGIARQIEKAAKTLSSKKGTGPYMAPEVARGERYGGNVDVYSLGIMLYRFLNGMRFPFLPQAPAPFTADDWEEAERRRLSGEPLPAPAGAPAGLAAVVCRACEADPRRRYQSARDFGNALRRFAGEGGKEDDRPEKTDDDRPEKTDDDRPEKIDDDRPEKIDDDRPEKIDDDQGGGDGGGGPVQPTGVRPGSGDNPGQGGGGGTGQATGDRPGGGGDGGGGSGKGGSPPEKKEKVVDDRLKRKRVIAAVLGSLAAVALVAVALFAVGALRPGPGPENGGGDGLSSTESYTVFYRCVQEDIATPKKVEGVSPGTVVTEYAIDVDGYALLDSSKSKSITVQSGGNNSIVFSYAGLTSTPTWFGAILSSIGGSYLDNVKNIEGNYSDTRGSATDGNGYYAKFNLSDSTTNTDGNSASCTLNLLWMPQTNRPVKGGVVEIECPMSIKYNSNNPDALDFSIDYRGDVILIATGKITQVGVTWNKGSYIVPGYIDEPEDKTILDTQLYR